MSKAVPFAWRVAACGIVAAVAAAYSASALANVSSCYAIRDADRKNMCLAQVKQQVSYCYSIKDADARHMCLAVVKKRRSDCYSIRSSDQKNLCLAQVP